MPGPVAKSLSRRRRTASPITVTRRSRSTCMARASGARRRRSAQALMTPFVQDRALLAKRINSAPELRQVAAAGGRATRGGHGLLLRRHVRARSRAQRSGRARGREHSRPAQAEWAAAGRRTFPRRFSFFTAMTIRWRRRKMCWPSAKEFTQVGADWQLHAYGGTMHSFTNPAANNPAGWHAVQREGSTALVAFADPASG